MTNIALFEFCAREVEGYAEVRAALEAAGRLVWSEAFSKGEEAAAVGRLAFLVEAGIADVVVVHGPPQFALAPLSAGTPTVLLAPPAPADASEAALGWNALGSCVAVHLDFRAHVLTRSYVAESLHVLPPRRGQDDPALSSVAGTVAVVDRAASACHVMEAMASGRCVIAPREPPFDVLIADHITGRLTGPNQDKQAVLAELDEAQRARLGRAAVRAALRWRTQWDGFQSGLPMRLQEIAARKIDPPCSRQEADRVLRAWVVGEEAPLRELASRRPPSWEEPEREWNSEIGEWESLSRVRRWMQETPAWGYIKESVPLGVRRSVALCLSKLLDRDG